MEVMPEQVDRDVLLSQYQASLKESSQWAARLEQTALLGALFLGIVTAFLFSFRANLSLAIAWMAPLLYLVVFGALLGLGARKAAAAWRSRILGRQLGQRVAADPPGPWRLSWKLGLLAGAAAVIFGGLFALVAVYCWRPVYAYNHLMGLAHAGFYLALALLEGLAAAELYSDLPRRYAAAFESGSLAGLELSPAHPLQTIWRWIVPFPRRLNHGLIFWAGFLVPVLIFGLNPSRLEILNALFRSLQDWETTAHVPLLAAVALGLLVFIASEILLQQAAAIFAAWRAGEAGDVPFPIPQFIVRWLAALLLGALIDRRGLLPLLVIISVYELVNILVVQPRRPDERGRYPLLQLLVEAGGLPLRFAAGLLVWGGPAWDFTVYLAIGVMVYFLALGLNAAARQKEARRRQEQGSSVNDYFLERGTYWRAVGLWSALLSSILLLALQTLTENCNIKPRSPFSSFYAFCPVKNVPPVYVQIDKLNSLLVAFDMLVLVLLIMLLLVRLLGPVLARQTASARPLNPQIVPVYFLVALVVAAIGFQHASAAWVAGGTAVALLGLIAKRDP
jgi:hypothetical protein